MLNSIKNKVLHIFAHFKRVFANNAGFILSFFIINFFTEAWLLVEEDKIEVMVGYGFTLFFATLLLAAGLNILPSKKLVYALKAILLAVCIIPFVVESFVMYNYKALIGIGIISSMLETNPKEAIEFLKMYVGAKEICGVVIILIALLYAWRKNLFAKINLAPPVKRRVMAVLFTACIVYAVRMAVVYTEFFFSDLLPLQRTASATFVAIDNIQAYKKLSSQVNADVELTQNDGKIKNVVIILGESMNRNHMQLYGYYLPNTPYLQRMADEGEIAVFRDIVSPHSTTIAVLCKLFTFCNFEAPKPWYEYSNLIDIMNAAGYKTHWLSNQESSGMWGNVAQVYANHSSMHKFTRIRDSLEDNGILDEELLPLLDEARKNSKSEAKNFFVLHLMGGHGLYYNRYPYRHHKFNAGDINLNISQKAKEIVAQYDNAVYYNDIVVKQIIDRFKDDEALVIYIPDHGEAVYDEGGFNGHIEENPNRHMIEIPMVAWASPKFKAVYPNKWDKIKKAVNRPYMTDDFIHTVLDLTDIRTKDYNPQKSITGDKFDVTRKRIFSDMDYDTQIKTGNLPPGEK